MPVLNNPRWELACQERAKGGTELQAYDAAGFSPDDGNASKFFSRPEIQARVQEITEESARLVTEALAFDRAKLLAELGKIANAPLDAAAVKPSDKRAALVDYARIQGWDADEAKRSFGEYDRMTDDELRAYVAGRIAGSGPREADAGNKGRSPEVPGKSSGVH